MISEMRNSKQSIAKSENLEAMPAGKDTNTDIVLDVYFVASVGRKMND